MSLLALSTASIQRGWSELGARGSSFPTKAGGYFTCPHTGWKHSAQLFSSAAGCAGALGHQPYQGCASSSASRWLFQSDRVASFWPCSSASRDLLPSLNTKIPPHPVLPGSCRPWGRLQGSPWATAFPGGKAGCSWTGGCFWSKTPYLMLWHLHDSGFFQTSYWISNLDILPGMDWDKCSKNWDAH